MLNAIVNGQIDLEEPQEWVVIWDAGLVPCITPGMWRETVSGSNRNEGMDDAGSVNISKGTKIKVIAQYIPAGSSPSQELWGLMVDEKGSSFWVALVLNTQPRAVFIEPEVKNEFHISGKLTDGRWKLSIYGYHKNIPFVFDW